MIGENELQALDRAICGAIWASDAVNRNLDTLCLECGSRFAGSESERRAVDFLTGRWREYGLSDVHAEPFAFTAWGRGHVTLEMTAPARRSYSCLALPYAPACDLQAEMVDMGYGMDADYGENNAKIGDQLRGKIALVKNGAPPGAARHLHRMEKYLLARAAGAVAFLFVDDQPGMLPPTGSLPFVQSGPLDQALPSVGVPYEVGLELSRRAAAGTVVLHLVMDNVLQRGTAYDVIGEIPGHDPSDGRVLMVGGHLDGHDIAQGAVDNGSGVIGVTEIARVLAPLREHLPCTVRFAGFGGEELGMLGSYAYVAAHPEQMDRIPFLFNLDIVGTGGNTFIALQNCPELLPYFERLSQGFAEPVEVSEQVIPFSDNFPYTIQGVPASYVGSTGEKNAGRGWAHTAADTLDKVNVGSIRTAAADIARLALRVANDRAGWPGRRRNAGEVKATLQGLGVEPLLRLEGVWPF